MGFSWGTTKSRSDRLMALGKLEAHVPVRMEAEAAEPSVMGRELLLCP